MTRDGVIKRVALKVNEIASEGEAIVSVVGAEDNNPTYAMIDGLLDEAVYEVYLKAPYYRLPVSRVPVANISFRDIFRAPFKRKKIVIRMPEDFLRMGKVDHPSLQRAVITFLPEDAPEVQMQGNQFLVAKEAKPIGVLGQDYTADDTLENTVTVYSLADDTYAANSVKATYVAKPDWNVEGDLPYVRATIREAIEWCCAAKVFSAQGNAQGKAICEDNAQGLLA